MRGGFLLFTRPAQNGVFNALVFGHLFRRLKETAMSTHLFFMDCMNCTYLLFYGLKELKNGR
jgi:hypothetical protein